jgi:tetratricopeptide (TPR) repeat protein
MSKITACLLVAITLSACDSKWNVQVDLKPEERQAIMAQIETAKQDIKNFDPKLDVGAIPWAPIIDEAKAYEKLGDRKDAIDLYNSWLKGNVKTKAMINNLGRLYDEVGETELAVKQYERIINEYMDTDYLLDITWAYIHGATASTGKKSVDFRKNAEKYFNAWQLDKKRTDETVQQAIAQLRKKEGAVKAN